MKYIVWDWNGTLLDDVPLCVDVMSGMLRRRGMPGLSEERYREIFTFPVRYYYQAAGLDLDREPFGALAEEFIAEYDLRALGCGLYTGAELALRQLRGQGFRQLIASASSKRALREQVDSCGITGYFEALLGVGDSLGVGKADLARDYFREHGVPSGEVLFVGDTVHDWQVARAMGCRCLLVAGGHQSRRRLEETGGIVLDSIGQVASWVAEASENRPATRGSAPTQQ